MDRHAVLFRGIIYLFIYILVFLVFLFRSCQWYEMRPNQ